VTAPRARLLLALALLLPPWALAVRRWWFVCDDAFISFRYARSWAQGQGLRFNPGEAPVEGFSNLLWVVVGAGVEALGLDQPTVMPALSALLGLLLWARVLQVGQRDLDLPLPALWAATAAVACAPGVAAWTTSGLEPMPQLALTWLAVEGLWLARPRWLAPMALVGLALVRTEGLAWAAVLLGSAALGRRPVGASAAALVVVTATGLGLRRAWFDAWVSNTATTKVGVSAALLARGLAYVLRNLAEQPLLALGLVLAALSWRRALAPALLALAFAAVSMGLLVGGDFMPLGRLLLPAWLAAWLGLAATLARLPRGAAAALAVGTLALGQAPLLGLRALPDDAWRALGFREPGSEGGTEARQWLYEVENAETYRQQAPALAAMTGPGDLIVSGPIGVLGWELPDRRFRDLYGLVTPAVARQPMARLVMPGHDKQVDPLFFLDEQPTVLASMSVVGANLRSALAPLGQDVVRMGIADRYAPALVRLLPDRDGQPRFVVAIRRAPDPAFAWARWEQGLDAPLQVPAVTSSTTSDGATARPGGR
jgi:arabinofuranosyltransferase